MMTYLKHVGNFNHSNLKTKKFEVIQALYEKIKRSDEDFISIGSAKDERLIKKMNEKGIDSSKTESVKEEDKEEEGDEHKTALKIVTFESILDSEIMEKKLVIARLNKFNHQMEIILLSTEPMGISGLSTISWRDQYSEVTLDGFELILWGDLKIMMESSTEGNEQSDFWSGQQDWNIVTWRLYPLSKDLLQRMLDLGLEVKRESSVALDLIRFIKQQIDEG
ncbi:hypothetical protein Tco_0255336 [Tanacetum coccineum]